MRHPMRLIQQRRAFEFILSVHQYVSVWGERIEGGGAASREFHRSLNFLISMYKPVIPALFPTKVSGTTADSICNRIGFDNWVRVEALNSSSFNTRRVGIPIKGLGVGIRIPAVDVLSSYLLLARIPMEGSGRDGTPIIS